MGKSIFIMGTELVKKVFVSFILILMMAGSTFTQERKQIRELDPLSASGIADDSAVLFGVDKTDVPKSYRLSLAELKKTGFQVVNVQQYGATGNDSTDDTDEIDTAITKLQTLGGGILYFPTGTYIVEGTVTFGASTDIATAFEVGTDPIYVIGDGIGNSIIQMGSNYPVRIFKGNGVVTDFHCRDITFLGNSLSDFSAGLAFAFETFAGVHIEHCEFLNLTGGVIDGANDASTQSSDFYMTNCLFDGSSIVSGSAVHLHNVKNASVTFCRFNKAARVFDVETDTARSCTGLVFSNNFVANGDRATRSGNESCIPVHVELEDTSEATNGVVNNNVFVDNHDDSTGTALAGTTVFLDHNGSEVLPWLPVVGDASANTLSYTSHGLGNSTQIRLVDGGSTPGGTDNTTLYYVVNTSANSFQISTTEGGGAVDFTTAGSGVVVLRVCTPDHTQDNFTITNHGLTNGRPVKFNHSGTMPTGLYKWNTYWVVNAAANTFQVALTRGGSAVTYTSNSSGLLTVTSPCLLQNWAVNSNVITGHSSLNTSQDYWLDNVHNVTLIGNTSLSAKHATPTIRGIFVRSSTHCTVVGNSIDESYGTGLTESTGCRKNIFGFNRVNSKSITDTTTSVSTDSNNLTGSTGY